MELQPYHDVKRHGRRPYHDVKRHGRRPYHDVKRHGRKPCHDMALFIFPIRPWYTSSYRIQLCHGIKSLDQLPCHEIMWQGGWLCRGIKYLEVQPCHDIKWHKMPSLKKYNRIKSLDSLLSRQMSILKREDAEAKCDNNNYVSTNLLAALKKVKR